MHSDLIALSRAATDVNSYEDAQMSFDNGESDTIQWNLHHGTHVSNRLQEAKWWKEMNRCYSPRTVKSVTDAVHVRDIRCSNSSGTWSARLLQHPLAV